MTTENMSISSDVSMVGVQATGGMTIVSASVSKTAETVGNHAVDQATLDVAASIMMSSEWLALASFIVMVISLIWNQFANRRRDSIMTSNHIENLEMKRRELELKERELALKEKGL